MGIQIGILRLNSHPQKEKHTILNDGFRWVPRHFPWMSHGSPMDCYSSPRLHQELIGATHRIRAAPVLPGLGN